MCGGDRGGGGAMVAGRYVDGAEPSFRMSSMVWDILLISNGWVRRYKLSRAQKWESSKLHESEEGGFVPLSPILSKMGQGGWSILFFAEEATLDSVVSLMREINISRRYQTSAFWEFRRPISIFHMRPGISSPR